MKDCILFEEIFTLSLSSYRKKILTFNVDQVIINGFEAD